MRRLVIGGVTGLIGLVAVGAALAETLPALNASVTPAKPGTQNKPKNVTLALDLDNNFSDPAAPPETMTELEIFLPSEFVFGGADFRSCTKDILTDGSPFTQCPSKSRVGTGSGIVRGFSGSTPAFTQNVNVTPYNGPKGKRWLLHLQSTMPFTVDSVLEGKLQNAGEDSFDRKSVIDIPAELEASAPFRIALTDLTFSMNAKTTVTYGPPNNRRRKTVPFIGLGKCSDDVLSFKTVSTFQDADPDIAADTVACDS
jgi:hypothetical protein